MMNIMSKASACRSSPLSGPSSSPFETMSRNPISSWLTSTTSASPPLMPFVGKITRTKGKRETRARACTTTSESCATMMIRSSRFLTLCRIQSMIFNSPSPGASEFETKNRRPLPVRMCIAWRNARASTSSLNFRIRGVPGVMCVVRIADAFPFFLLRLRAEESRLLRCARILATGAGPSNAKTTLFRGRQSLWYVMMRNARLAMHFSKFLYFLDATL
mmetsp:Transcript_15152/g.57594  ORF Transcript_15152/g.57594 Transcript_15152/m.57594 type:complete len:218 (+) Transcript_15152:2949-3602(+)